MRWMAGLAIAAGWLGAGAAAAASAPAPAVPIAEALAQAAFAPNPEAAAVPGSAGDLMRWRSGETRLSVSDQGPVDTLRVTVGAPDVGRGGLPLAFGARAPAYEVEVVRRWPRAIRFDAAGVDLDVSPHAGLGLGSDGSGSAEAGAMLQVSRGERMDALARERLKALGVRDGVQFGARGRFYLFAAASGRAVGLNMLHGDQGWNRAGWSTDPTSRLIGDAQVGVGWRKGAMQTSLGFVHREVKGDHMLYGVDPHADSMVAFSFSLKPQAR
jgi:hypothetical protein